MKQYKINEVFEDTENFPEPKRLKCIPFVDFVNNCKKCVYLKLPQEFCNKMRCFEPELYFIETTEPLTTQP